MLRLTIAFSMIALLVLVMFVARDTYSPASAGIFLPPAGEDILEINGQVTIDLGEIGFGTEKIALAGTMTMVRSDPSPEGTIDIKIVAMSLTGDSNLLKGPTPIELHLNENAPQSLGLIDASSGFPAESFFDIQFMDVQIGEFAHFLNKTVQMSGSILGIPPFGDKFDSGSKEHPIIDNLDADSVTGLRGFLSGLNIDVKPPDKTYTITVLKQHADTKAGLPGWEMNLYAGHGCEGDQMRDNFTGGDGIAEFSGLAPGDYSVEEKLEDGWNNITPLCQDTTVPATGGSGVAGLPPCPHQPDLPPPAAGCDEFNSVASVNVEFTNPPGAQIHCALSGPTQITRSAVSGSPDNIQTEITAMELTGTCDPGSIDVTVRQSPDPDRASTGKITEQQNNEPGVLEFKANSFFDIFFEVDVGGTILHNQEALHLECKIQDIPPYGCFYEPDVGTVTLYNDDKKEVAKLIHAAHIPLDPKQKLLIFINEPKPAMTPPPTLNPDFEEKIDACIDAQVIANPGTAPIWTKSQIDTLVEGSDAIWSQANINITWNNDITDIDDPNTDVGEVGDIIDTFKSDTEFNALDDNANSPGKEKCVRVFFVRHFIDNDGTQYESADGDVTLAEADGKGRGHYIVISLKAKDNSQTFAHELGHIFGLQHNDPEKEDNLMNSFKDGGDTQLNKDQMRTAREGAADVSAQPTPTPGDDTPTPTPMPGDETPTPGDETTTPTPTLGDDTPTPTLTATKTPQPQRTRHVTLRCLRTSSSQKVTGSATVTEKKVDQPDRVVLEVSCNSNTNPIVRTSYSISAGATKNVRLEVTVDSRDNDCSFPGFAATQAVSVSCTASPEGLELTDGDEPGEPDDGDANKNGTTDSIDAALILQFIAGLTDPWPNSDTNENGITNAIDVALILQFSAGLIPSLPV